MAEAGQKGTEETVSRGWKNSEKKKLLKAGGKELKACTGGRTGQIVTCSDGKGWNFASESQIWLRRHQERMWLLLAA